MTQFHNYFSSIIHTQVCLVTVDVLLAGATLSDLLDNLKVGKCDIISTLRNEITFKRGKNFSFSESECSATHPYLCEGLISISLKMIVLSLRSVTCPPSLV